MRPRSKSVVFALLLIAAGSRRSARADEYGELPIAVEIRVVKFAEQELARVERLLKQQRGLEPDKVSNVTVPLQNYVEDELGAGNVVLYPRAVFDVALRALRGGTRKEDLAKRLVSYQRDGRFGKIARGEAADVSTRRRR